MSRPAAVPTCNAERGAVTRWIWSGPSTAEIRRRLHGWPAAELQGLIFGLRWSGAAQPHSIRSASRGIACARGMLHAQGYAA
jgi:hypothetical protein